MDNNIPVQWADLVGDRIILDGKPIFGHIPGATSYHLYNDEHELIAIVRVRPHTRASVLENA